MHKNISAYLTFLFWLIVISIMFFGGINWLHIDSKALSNWWVGLLAFGWMLLVVKVPWNIYFEAADAIDDAATSKDRGIEIDPKTISYLGRVKAAALIAAIILHLVSAAVLYILEFYGVTTIGYIGAGLALLLTGVRPGIRLYRYVSERLKLIRTGMRYPREDIVELRERVEKVEAATTSLTRFLSLNERDSWASKTDRKIGSMRNELLAISAHQRDMQIEHKKTEEQMARKAEAAISQINEDSQALNHVREIIRFFKTA